MQLFEILVIFLYKYTPCLNPHTAKYFANARRDTHINVSGIKKAGIKCSLLKFLVVSRSAFFCGANVPDETGKMSRSDKRGTTLPKVAAVATLPRNDRVNYLL